MGQTAPEQEDEKRSENSSSSSPEKGKPLVRSDSLRQSKGKCVAKPKSDVFLVDQNYSTFEELCNRAFADKTMFLKKFLANEKIYRFTLPRAMGKTLLLKMVESFCDVQPVRGVPIRPNDDKRNKLWEDTEIKLKENDFFEDHFGRHPTIFITLRDVCGDRLEIVLEKFREALNQSCKKFRYIYDDMKLKKNKGKTNPLHLEFLENALNKPNQLNEAKLSSSLKILAEIVKEFHGGAESKPVLLMDEYEKPVSYLFTKDINKDEMDKIIGFHNLLMISTFKENPSISHAIMAGVLKTGPSDLSCLRGNDCNLLEDTELNQYFGLSKDDIQEMAAAVQEKCSIAIPENIQKDAWSCCNGYSYFLDGDQYDFCNPYTCCKFLNEYIKMTQTRGRKLCIPALMKICSEIGSLVSYLKPLFETEGDIAEKLTCIVANYKRKEKSLNHPTIQIINNQQFSSDKYKEFKKAMNSQPFEESEEITSMFMAYLFQVGILTSDCDGNLVIPNKNTLHQMNGLLKKYFVQKFQFSIETANKVTTALQNISSIQGLNGVDFLPKIKEFKKLFTQLLIDTKHNPGAEHFPHALITTLSANIRDKSYFIADEGYECVDKEKLLIDLAFALKINNRWTTTIIEMKYRKSETAEMAVKEAMFYRKVFDDITQNQGVTFHRFIFIGISVPENFQDEKAIQMCYRIENGTIRQPDFKTPPKFNKNTYHQPKSTSNDFAKLGIDYFNVDEN